ncbi:MAG TPA: PIG-L family deacetylase [Candidatus Acidoferrales bacterium]|nr:PIG-L family deacetylase [Candidatus Acidoferrales bacterium]
MNPYRQFVDSHVLLLQEGKSLPLGGIAEPPKAPLEPNASVALLFSPHPDDECITGGLALRLLRETKMRVVNVAVTQGSNRERQAARWRELKNACDWIGFGLERTAPNGLEKINPKTRLSDPTHWTGAVKTIAATLARYRPRVVVFPHEHDWNSTHIGTHFLVMDALQSLPADFHCLLIESEFWGQMISPNLMVESSADDVAALLTALSFHVGEVQRNPYHLRLPGWLIDNVRRGAELVGGQGGVAPEFTFATLYRVSHWKNGRVEEAYVGGKQIAVGESPAQVLGI